jgi:hypothetical protein
VYVSSYVADPAGAEPILVIRVVGQDGEVRTHRFDIRVKDRLLAQLKAGKVPPPSPGSYGLDVPHTRPKRKGPAKRRRRRKA